MKFTLNPFALWRKLKYYETFLRIENQLLMFSNEFVRALIEEGLVKDRMIKRLETDLKNAEDRLKEERDR